MSVRNKWWLLVFVLTIATGAAWMVNEATTYAAAYWREERLASQSASDSSEGAKLLADITAFRTRGAGLSSHDAVTTWLALWDRADKLNDSTSDVNEATFDSEIDAQVGFRSVIAALPNPASWGALRGQVVARGLVADDRSALVLDFLSSVLVRDQAAIMKSLAALDGAAAVAEEESRDDKRAAVRRARSIVHRLYGTREQIVESFQAELASGAENPAAREINAPDLVGLVGAAKAEMVIREALQSPILLSVPEGEATRTLTRRLAYEEIAAMRVPQWALVNAPGTAKLYEAIQKRFDGRAADKPVDADAAENVGYQRRGADVYYMIDMIVAGNQDAAERAMQRGTGGGSHLTIPRSAADALVKAGKSEALYNFLARALEREPERHAWSALIERGGFLGRGKDTLALLDRALRRTDLSQELRTDLTLKRLDALLAADQVDDAIAGYLALLRSPPDADEKTRDALTQAALRLAGMGRVLKRPELADVGFKFATQAVASPTGIGHLIRGSTVETELRAELRRQGRVAEVAALAQKALAWNWLDLVSTIFGEDMFSGAKLDALTELAGIHDAAGRHAEVLELLTDTKGWGVADLRDIAATKDSLGTPIGMMAARALKARGENVAANNIARALLDQLPGHDPAYALLVELNGASAPEMLEKRYALDQFEERPLIWKAVALNAGRQYVDAEVAARRAIAIDPSDGEQGVNDRMRAYAALAESLEGQGGAANIKAAQIYRGAVAAIRKSEQADEHYKLGLYHRAFEGYRAALNDFSDAYCIQSRLAVQLGKLGLQDEAMKHYRRAFELMPESFGRVESHCFGCESVFADGPAQAVAESVFTDLIKGQPTKPQAPYMLGYLRKDQGRYDDAVKLFRQAATLDGQYLNAWKHLQELGKKTYINASDRDQTSLRLLELDPRERHVKHRTSEVADLAALWNTVERVGAKHQDSPMPESLHALAASKKKQDAALVDVPPELRRDMEHLKRTVGRKVEVQRVPRPGAVIARHGLVREAMQFLGERVPMQYDD